MNNEKLMLMAEIDKLKADKAAIEMKAEPFFGTICQSDVLSDAEQELLNNFCDFGRRILPNPQSNKMRAKALQTQIRIVSAYKKNNNI